MMRRRRLEVLDGGAAGADASLGELSDDDLMRLLRREQQRAFEVLIRRHQPVVLGYATRYLGDRALAVEATQDIFLGLWTERHSYQPRGKLRSYLMTMTVHRCQYLARQRRSNTERVGRLAAEPRAERDAETPLQQLLAEERAAEVQRLLAEVDEKTRCALSLRFCSELSYPEIAEITGQPEGTIKAQVCRGLRRLHRLAKGSAR